MDIQSVKLRFGIIGNSPLLNRAINVAMQVAPTDLTVLVTGESGTGKEVFPKIIHQLSKRKHGNYIAVNCGAIPEGTIDSELFGHEKGSFTGAHETRKGYFEVANGGTIFLDEVAELPLSTQVRLLRVLETGEFLKVGSSKVQKTDVRVVAATNVNIPKSIQEGKFREDLYYRLNTIPIYIPPLRERKEDIHLLFRKFAADFAEKYRMPPLRLTPDAVRVLEKIDAETLKKYLPNENWNELPVLYNKKEKESISERELLYKVLFDMQKDLMELKKIVYSNIANKPETQTTDYPVIKDPGVQLPSEPVFPGNIVTDNGDVKIISNPVNNDDFIAEPEIIEESLSLQDKEKEMIKKALEKHNGKRKAAAKDLGISERTLYRKIKEYNIK